MEIDTYKKIIEHLKNIQDLISDFIKNDHSLLFSIISLIITIAALIIAWIIYKNQKRDSKIEQLIILITSFNLIYKSLYMHFILWKDKDKNLQTKIKNFWKEFNFIEILIQMQKIETLSKLILTTELYYRVQSLLIFLQDLISISKTGTPMSNKKFEELEIIDGDRYIKEVNGLVEKLSKKIGFKNKNHSDHIRIDKIIKERFFI